MVTVKKAIVMGFKLGKKKNDTSYGNHDRKNMGRAVGSGNRVVGSQGRTEPSGKISGSLNIQFDKFVGGNTSKKNGNNGDKAGASNIAKFGIKARVRVDNDKDTIMSYKNRGSRFDILEKAMQEEQEVEISNFECRNKQPEALSDITNGKGSRGFKGNHGEASISGKGKNIKISKSFKGSSTVKGGPKAKKELEDFGVLKHLPHEVVAFKGFQILDSKPSGISTVSGDPQNSIQNISTDTIVNKKVHISCNNFDEVAASLVEVIDDAQV
ncbi:hypothetical protein ACOSQ2_014286 [Xanthoceras sorbifolium]